MEDYKDAKDIYSSPVIEETEALGGEVKNIYEAPKPKEKADFPKKDFIQENVGSNKEYVGEDGTRYDKYGNVILQGSSEEE